MMTLKVITLIISVIGVLGTLLPAVPGTPLIILASLIYGWLTGFTLVGWKLILILIILSILAEGSEYLASVLGAKYFGASKYGILGSICGGILGLILLGPLGILVGPILGAISVEMIMGKEFKKAIKVGLGTILGAVSGSILSFSISVVMAALLLIRVF